MATFYPLGRLGTELCQLPLYSLDMMVKNSPDGDPWLRGETLEVIIKRIATLSGRDYIDVKQEVIGILKEKHEKAENLKNTNHQAMLLQECGGFGGAMICDFLENE